MKLNFCSQSKISYTTCTSESPTSALSHTASQWKSDISTILLKIIDTEVCDIKFTVREEYNIKIRKKE